MIKEILNLFRKTRLIYLDEDQEVENDNEKAPLARDIRKPSYNNKDPKEKQAKYPTSDEIYIGSSNTSQSQTISKNILSTSSSQVNQSNKSYKSAFENKKQEENQMLWKARMFLRSFPLFSNPIHISGIPSLK